MNKNQYLERVIQQIKSEEAREFVKKELDNHLEAAIQSLCSSGMDRDEAERAATEKMGSAETLGVKMGKLHRPRVDWSMWGAAILLLFAGFLPFFQLDESYPVTHMLFRKTIDVAAAAAIITALMLFDYRKLARHIWLIPSLAGAVLLFFYLFGNRFINGSLVFHLGSITLRSILLLPLLFVGWAVLFNTYSHRLLVLFAVFLATFFVYSNFGDLSLLFIYCLMVFSMFLWTVRRRKKLLAGSIVTSVAAVAGFLTLVLKTGAVYQKERLLGFMNPEAYAQGAGYLNLLIQKYLSSARLFGSADSTQLSNLREAHTDFAFVSILSSFGWLAAIILLLLLSYVAVRMLWIARGTHDPFGQLLIIGGTVLFTLPFVYNIAMVFGFVPIGGFYLPFLTYGTTPTLVSAIVIGLVLSVYRRDHLIPKTAIVSK